MFRNKLNLRNLRKGIAIAICLAGVIVFSGCDNDVLNRSSSPAEPNIEFVAGSPVTETLRNSGGFCDGSRVNFALIVYDAAGLTSITIEEVSSNNTIKQTRVIAISGPGTYPLSQEIRNRSVYADRRGTYTYTVSAHGKSYSRNFSGCYYYIGNSSTPSYSHYFAIK